LATLSVKGLRAGYGRAQVLFDIDLDAREGEVVALLGRNGAGKSTTLKAIMGLVPPLSGEVLFDGRSVKGLEPYEIARLGLGYVPEDRRIFTDLTVSENLEVGRQPARGAAPAWSEERLFELFPALGALRTRRGARMSGGEQQMLCIARTLAGNPSAILLDEPSEGLAPVVVEQVAKAIMELKRSGLAVLLAEQSRHFTGRVADRAYVLEKGVITKA
jgi:branched-chain amino acid transport system ATP-binding protein